MNKIYELIIESLKTIGGKTSSTRIISYILVGVVILFSLTFLGIEIASAVLILNTGAKYVISNEIVVIFTALLSHILILLGINKSNEKKVSDESGTSVK